MKLGYKHQEEDRGQKLSQEQSLEALEILSDTKNRSILVKMRDRGGSLTAKEISEECDIPLSTVYRKLDKMLDASLIKESTKLRKGCTHTHTYEVLFENIEVSVTEEGVEAEVSRSERREKPVGQRFS